MFLVCVFLLLFLAASACSSPTRIVVGSKNFTEQIILSEMIAQRIERAGLEVDRRFNLGGNVCHQAMVSGQMDVYVEYTGTALTSILKEPVVHDRDAVYRRVREAYAAQFGIEWTEPLGFNNTFAIIVRADDARRLNLKTISDAAPHTRNWVAGFGFDFRGREDGYPGLARVYGLTFSVEPKVMDMGLTYRALADRQVDLISGNSTDGLIDSLNLAILEDDRKYFPPYDAVPLLRHDTAARHPSVREVLRGLGNKVSEAEMRKMNFAVDGERRDVKAVVAEFLRLKGL